jgi:uncharacterized protein YozE (UPF0346 family)
MNKTISRARRRATFFAWLRQQHRRDDRVGDLARDAKADPAFPKSVSRHNDLLAYLHSKSACGDALETTTAA